MKLRILSLVLCLAMLVCTFASCEKKKDNSNDVVSETATRTAMTVSMYVICEEGTTDEAADAVEKAINSMIKSKYTTKVEITYLTADQYYSAVEAQFETMKENVKKNPDDGTGTADESADAPETEELVIGENGVAELRYPSLTPGQIDIVMIDDYSKYEEFVENGWITSLDSALSGTFKKLGDYIYPATFDAAKIDGKIYAVPNNGPIASEATYITVNRELAKEFKLDTYGMDSIVDLADFLDFVATKDGVTPIRNKSADMGGVLYMGADASNRVLTSEFSLVGQYGKSATLTAPESLFANKAYTDEILGLAKFGFDGYFGNGSDENYAVEIKTGDLNDMCADSEKNEIIVLSAKAKPAKEICSSMFAVSAFSDSDAFNRAMEIVTYLNTNEEFRNLFQYGIEGTNYILDEYTDEIVKLTSDYNMDLAKTGNMFIAYPDEGMSMNIWELAKMQNLATVPYDHNIFGGFKVPADIEGETPVDFESAKALAKASSEVKAKLDACRTYEEYEAFVNSVAEAYGEVIESFITGENTPCALYVASLS